MNKINEQPTNPSPMMEQYLRIKEQLPSEKTLLAFRLGAYFEFFFDDAETASKALNIRMDCRNGVRMTGVVYHESDKRFKELIERGHTVAIVDVEKEEPFNKPVTRKIVKTITKENFNQQGVL